jgi:hypothetical protein
LRTVFSSGYSLSVFSEYGEARPVLLAIVIPNIVSSQLPAHGA